MKKFSDPKGLTFGVRGLKTSLSNLGPKPLGKDLSSHCSRTLAPIFSNRTSLSQESRDECNKIMLSQKNSRPWVLRPRNYIWANWAQKTNQAITPEP